MMLLVLLERYVSEQRACVKRNYVLLVYVLFLQKFILLEINTNFIVQYFNCRCLLISLANFIYIDTMESSTSCIRCIYISILSLLLDYKFCLAKFLK